jgi:hypothetical protein
MGLGDTRAGRCVPRLTGGCGQRTLVGLCPLCLLACRWGSPIIGVSLRFLTGAGNHLLRTVAPWGSQKVLTGMPHISTTSLRGHPIITDAAEHSASRNRQPSLPGGLLGVYATTALRARRTSRSGMPYAVSV